MMKPSRCVSLASLAVGVMFLSGAHPAGQTVVIKPGAPPAAEKPEPQKPEAAKPEAGKPEAKPETARPDTQKPSPPPMPPDRQAYIAITKITDNDEKLAALDKWLQEFPDSPGKTTALGLRFDTLIKHRPADRTAIVDAGQALIDAGTEGFRAGSYSRVASGLLNAGIFLDDAARIAEKGLSVFEEEENKRVATSRATHLATLGRIRLKQGRVAEAEKAMKAAYAANPEIPNALIGLAELSAGKKDTKAALEYWMRAALTGRLSRDDRAKFENAYRAANYGAIDGLEAAMDAAYKAAFPPPFHPEPYKPTPARTDKVVLAEVFTGAGCPPCVAADLAFDAALERYSRKDLAVVMYHLHIPVPDPLTNKATVERAKYYSVNGVPTAAIEGESTVGGGGRSNTKMVFDRIRASIDKGLEAAAGAALQVEASIAGGRAVRVKATPAGLAADGDAVKLQVLLVEEMLSYSGENGVRFHPMVVRSIAGENYGGFTVDRKAPAVVEHVFDLAEITKETQDYIDEYEKTRGSTSPGFAFSRKPVEMSAGNLSVVVFLQEEKSKKVLQTSYVRLSPASTNTVSR
jgi:tetratricopeptide (TPR) repeat protein